MYFATMSYQDVWLRRLGYEDEAAYREAVGDALEALGALEAPGT